MACEMVVQRYLHKSATWPLTCLGRFTIKETKIPRQADVSGLVRVVSHIINISSAHCHDIIYPYKDLLLYHISHLRKEECGLSSKRQTHLLPRVHVDEDEDDGEYT